MAEAGADNLRQYRGGDGDVTDIATTAPTVEADPDDGARPTALLPIAQLLRISLYWLGLTAIDAAVGLFVTTASSSTAPWRHPD